MVQFSEACYKGHNGMASRLLEKLKGEYALSEDMLHVWCVSTDDFLRFLPTFQQNLSEDECARAGKYHFKEDSNCFILRRGILRILISNYLELEAKNVQFYYGKNGKPRIVNNYSDKTFSFNFNMSHSKNLLLYAIARNREVGIDIEYVRPIPEMEQIVEICFSNKEKAIFNGLSAALKKDFFFQAWTRKEAFFKATGEGLSQLTRCLELISSENSFETQNSQKTSKGWCVEELCMAPGVSAACAAEGTGSLKGAFFGNAELYELV